MVKLQKILSTASQTWPVLIMSLKGETRHENLQQLSQLTFGPKHGMFVAYLNFCFDIVDCVAALHLQSYGLPSQSLHEDLHAASEKVLGRKGKDIGRSKREARVLCKALSGS
jgi:hypothetical protein